MLYHLIFVINKELAIYCTVLLSQIGLDGLPDPNFLDQPDLSGQF